MRGRAIWLTIWAMGESAAGTKQPSARVGEVLNQTYKLERLIGQGGMGAVFEASHARLPRHFAIKLLSAEVAEEASILDRFQREAEIASSLGHENITQVFDINRTEDGVPYMVLELLEGEDLSDFLDKNGRLGLPGTVGLLDQVASGLEAAHAKGIVHRDLKPQNLFLCRRQGRPDLVKILDFGISKITHSETHATRTGAILGTPNYMSPEQADGRPDDIDSRTDIFAMGAILYECLTGRRAFQGPTLMGTLYQICHGEPEPLPEIVTGVPEGVVAAIAHALAKAKDERTPTIGQLRDEMVAACPPEVVAALGQAGRRTPVTGVPVIAAPSVAGNPITGNPITGNPITGNPITGNPITGNPITGNPITGNPITGNPITGNPITGNPITGAKPITGNEATIMGPGLAEVRPATGGGATSRPVTGPALGTQPPGTAPASPGALPPGAPVVPTTMSAAASQVVPASVASQKKSRRSLMMVVGGLGVAALSGVAVFAVLGRGDHGTPPAPVAESEPGTDRAAVEPPAAPVAPATTEPAVEPAPTPPQPEAAVQPPQTPAVPMVEISLKVSPEGARIEVDGVQTDANPLRLPRSSEMHEVVISASGYRSETHKFRAVANGAMKFSLKKRSSHRDRPERSRDAVANKKPPDEKPPDKKPPDKTKTGLYETDL